MPTQDTTCSMEWGGRTLTIETGTFAQQANGAVTVRYGDTMVLVTAVSAPPREGVDFFPLTVDFEERMYAAGKIPGSRFIRREGRPSERAILTGRLIDRTIRPLFPKDFVNEVQVIVTTLSADTENFLDIPGLIGASAALCISDIPFDGPVVGIKVGYQDGQYLLNPTYEQLASSDLELLVAGGPQGINMIEAGARQVTEEVMYGGIQFAWENMQPVFEWQREIVAAIGRPKMTTYSQHTIPEDVIAAVKNVAGERVRAALLTPRKAARDEELNALREAVLQEVQPQFEENLDGVRQAFEAIVKEQVRSLALQEQRRVDGRGLHDMRSLRCQVGFVPRAHGSALFSRGETQVISVTTLGSVGEEKLIDGLGDEESKRYMHQYNFPPYSTGEVRPLRGPGRREIGHGALAEKALVPVMPDEIAFPYTVRVVSEVLSSNGSTSMASVCGATLSLMDAGVPISHPVAGISIGLVLGEKGRYVLLTDIMGIEDHCGDMDFKVAGTRQGITAVQLDLKTQALPMEIIPEVLERAREARHFILDTMTAVLDAPRSDLSQYAPRIMTLKIPVDKIGGVIGPGGKTIRAIIERTDTKIDIEDDGTVFITAVDPMKGQEAYTTIEDMVREVEVGQIYTGKVTRILPFGAFVEVLPGKEGLIHISQLDWRRVATVEDVLNVGDEVTVKVAEIDDQGRVNLTRKELLPKPEGYIDFDRAPGRPSSPRSGGHRGGTPRGRTR